MNTIKTIFKIGKGPSSSHTIGPYNATKAFIGEINRKNIKKINKIRASLYGSLALTGRGHLTDKAIIEAASGYNVEVLFFPEKILPFHPNGMVIDAISKDGKSLLSWEIYSIGGGEVLINFSKNDDSKNLVNLSELEGNEKKDFLDIYPFSTMEEILTFLRKSGKSFWEYVEDFEGSSIWDYLSLVWQTMLQSIDRGINREGVLPGNLHIYRKASLYHAKSLNFMGNMQKEGLLYSYALAVAEENACGGIIATAPTCGSSGVLPAILFHLKGEYNITEHKILRALATAGLIGKLVQTNASISGAEVGCQGEIGVACSMAAAAATYLLGGTPSQIEYAAEMGLEHHLGLTCDPLGGYVQIPCIERNAFAAARAIDACLFPVLSDGSHKISFDKIVEVMKQTGKDLPSIYKETSLGGIAYVNKENEQPEV